MEMAPQSCPRRLLEYGPWESEEGLDAWQTEPRREGEQTPFCSFCGSLHPERFFELVREGWTVSPTDKNYKAYLKGGGLWAKFYFQHLSHEQQGEFIALYNTGEMSIAEPGHFYVAPFFVRDGRAGV